MLPHPNMVYLLTKCSECVAIRDMGANKLIVQLARPREVVWSVLPSTCATTTSRSTLASRLREDAVHLPLLVGNLPRIMSTTLQQAICQMGMDPVGRSRS